MNFNFRKLKGGIDENRKKNGQTNDTLVKRQASFAGDVMHEFHGFPGTNAGPCMNEYPNVDGGVPRTDATYYVNYHGQKFVMNWEDESKEVDENVIQKSNKYRRNLEYIFKTEVISAITTIQPLKEHKLKYIHSPTFSFDPIIISYPEWNGSERLSTITTKIEDEKVLSKVEAMNLIMIPKMFTENQDIILEKVCELLPKLRIEDSDFKLELVLEMRCIIHKYAKTLNDINRLEGVIGLQEVITAKQFQDQKLIDQGIAQGIEQGAFEMAIKFKKALGIETVTKISQFTKEELENEKLNR